MTEVHHPGGHKQEVSANQQPTNTSKASSPSATGIHYIPTEAVTIKKGSRLPSHVVERIEDAADHNRGVPVFLVDPLNSTK